MLKSLSAVLLCYMKQKINKYLMTSTQNNLKKKLITEYLGSKVGIQATFENADICRELIRASSETPPDFERGPTASTLHKISSLQNPCKIFEVKHVK